MADTDPISVDVAGLGTVQFPAGTSEADMKQAIDTQLAQAHVAAEQPVPHPIVARLLSWLPAAGGVVGSLVGAAAGVPEGGPIGAVPMGFAGATLGGSTGEALRELGNRAVGNPAPQTPMAAASNVGRQGANQGIVDLAGAAAGKVVGAVAAPIAAGLKQGAVRSMIAALGPAGRGTGPAGREALQGAKQIAPRLLEERFAPLSHEAALTQVGQRLDTANQAVDDIFSGLPADTTVPTATVINTLEAAKGRGQVSGVDFGTGELTNSVIDRTIDKLKAMGPNVTPAQAVQARQLIGPLAKWTSLATAPEQVAAKANQTVYNGIRSAIEDLHPDIADANQDIHFWLKAQTILEKASQRPQAPSSGTSGAILGGMAKAASGGPASVLTAAAVGRYVQRAMRSPGWRFVSANVKDALADAITQGNLGKVASLTAKIAGAPVASSLTQDQP